MPLLRRCVVAAAAVVLVSVLRCTRAEDAIPTARNHTTMHVACEDHVVAVSTTTLLGPQNGSAWGGWVRLSMNRGTTLPGTREYVLRDGRRLAMNLQHNDSEVGRHVVELYTFHPALCAYGGVVKQTWTYTIVPLLPAPQGPVVLTAVTGLPAFAPRGWEVDDALAATRLLQPGVVLDVTVPVQALAALSVPVVLHLRQEPVFDQAAPRGGHTWAATDRLPLPATLRLNCVVGLTLSFTYVATQAAGPTAEVAVPLRRGMGSVVLDVSAVPGTVMRVASLATVCGVGVGLSSVSRTTTALVPSAAEWANPPTATATGAPATGPLPTGPASAWPFQTASGSGLAGWTVSQANAAVGAGVEPGAGANATSRPAVPQPPAGTLLTPAGDVVVAPGATLTLLPGTSLLMASGAAIVCHDNSSVVLDGAADRPVYVQAAGNRVPWGGIVAHSGCLVRLRHAVLHGSGGASAPDQGYGHRAERPLIRAHPASNVAITHTALLNGVGQALGTDGAIVRLHRTLVWGFVSGGQLTDTAAAVVDCTFTDFPAADQVATADDHHDGLYVAGGTTHILHSAFLFAKGDCLDSGTAAGGHLLVQHSWFEHCLHEGVALSNVDDGQVAGRHVVADGDAVTPKMVVVEDSVVAHCQQGLELGFSTSRLWVWASRLLLRNNDVGVRYSDNYGWQTAGFLHVAHSVLADNRLDFLNSHTPTGGPVAGHRVAFEACAFGSELTPADVRASGAFWWDAAVWSPATRPSLPSDWRAAAPNGGGVGPVGLWVAHGLQHPFTDAAVAAAVAMQTTSLRAVVAAALPWTAAWRHAGGRSQVPHRYRGEDLRWSVHRHCAVHQCSCATRAAGLRLALGLAEGDVDVGTVDEAGGDALCAASHKPTAGLGMSPSRLTAWQWHGGEAYHEPRGTRWNTRRQPPPAGDQPDGDRPPPDIMPLAPAATHSELHIVIVWHGATQAVTEDIHTLLRALPSTDPSLSSVRVVLARTVSLFDPPENAPLPPAMHATCPAELQPVVEEWYRGFYGNTYHLSSHGVDNAGGEPLFQDMATTKGTGPFSLLVLEDTQPLVAARHGKGLVNINMYVLKERLRQLLPRPGSFLVHASHTRAEGLEDAGFLYGETDRHHLLQRMHHGAMATRCQLGRSDLMSMILPSENIMQAARDVMFKVEGGTGTVPAADADMVLMKQLSLGLSEERLTMLLTLPSNMQWFAYIGSLQEVAQLMLLPTQHLHDGLPWGYTCYTVARHARFRLKQLGAVVTERGDLRAIVQPSGLDAPVMQRVLALLPNITPVDATVVVVARSPSTPLLTLWDGNHRALTSTILRMMCEAVLTHGTGQNWLRGLVGADTAAHLNAACNTVTAATPVRIALGVSPDLDAEQAVCATVL